MSYLFQTILLALIQRLINSLPMEDLHRQNHFEPGVTFTNHMECMIEGLDFVAGRAPFLRLDPFCDAAQVFVYAIAVFAARSFRFSTALMSAAKLQLETNLHALSVHDQLLWPDLEANLMFLNDCPQLFADSL